MDAKKAVALVLVVSYCAVQAAGCTSPSGERSRASGGASTGASSGARAVLDDAALTAKVTSALTAAGIANPLKINVSTENGVVQLSGFIDSEDKARRAGEIARQVEGVKRLYNDIRIAPPRA
jgi:osmotically-inducible protein OsmY